MTRLYCARPSQPLLASFFFFTRHQRIYCDQGRRLRTVGPRGPTPHSREDLPYVSLGNGPTGQSSGSGPTCKWEFCVVNMMVWLFSHVRVDVCA